MAGTRGARQRQRTEEPTDRSATVAGSSSGVSNTVDDPILARRGRVSFLNSPVQWFAVFTLVVAAAAAISEANRKDVRSWSIFVQSAIGVIAGSLAWFLNRWGGRLGVLWGVSQAVVVAVDGKGWIGKQFIATYVGTTSNDPAAATGTTIAVNAIGGFFACVWGWFLLKERWSAPRRS